MPWGHNLKKGDKVISMTGKKIRVKGFKNDRILMEDEATGVVIKYNKNSWFGVRKPK